MLSHSIAYSVQKERCVPDVHGAWTDWSSWSACTASCDQGTTNRRRNCVGQSGNGRPCYGLETQNDFCKLKQCSKGNGIYQ